MPRPYPRRPLIALLIAVILAPALFVASPGPAAALEPGFQDDLVVGVASPTALAFTPDGRMLVTTQPGKLRVYAGGALLPTAALDLAQLPRGFCNNSERGLLGVAIDPDFATNRFIYLYYTAKTSPSATCTANVLAYNRVSRFILPDSNVIDLNSEVNLIDNIPSPAGNHNGGDLNFGKDGFLYISVGDGGCDYNGDSGCAGANDATRDRHSLVGKILRITRDGGTPTTNPFVNEPQAVSCKNGNATPGAICQETFSWGLRNPFRFAFDPNTAGTRFFINDVGQGVWEEIDAGQAGADYGWNCREGAHTNSTTGRCSPTPTGMVDPIHEYNHNTGCASITGGAFVPNGVWPAAYDNAYLFSDYVCGKVFLLKETTPGTWTRSEFLTGLGGSSAVHLRFGPSGGTQALYYTTYADGGEVRRLSYQSAANSAPTAAFTASPRSGVAPLQVDFNGAASSDPDAGDTLSWEWDFGDGASTTTAVPTVSHTYTVAATRVATLRVRDNRGALSPPATVTIGVGNTPPTPTIVSPAVGTFYTPGQSYLLTGGATDAQDGTLADSQLTWQVILHHNGHTHPVLTPTTGNAITFTAPFHEEGSSYLEIVLTATDAQGLATTVTRALALGGAGFSDVPADSPAYTAISELAARGVINGYGDGTFGPGDIVLRAQSAALIVRAMGWSGETASNPFPDQGVVDNELWAAVAILASRGVALGYPDGTYDPTGPVLHIQVVSFVSRAMVEAGLWAAATEDDPTIYPNVQVAASDRLDLVTYVRNAGAVPDRPAAADWPDWDTPASRGWFARTLWQALDGPTP